MIIELNKELMDREGETIDGVLGRVLVTILDSAPGIQSAAKKNACVRLANKLDDKTEYDFSDQERDLVLLCVKNAPWSFNNGAYIQMQIQCLLGDDALGDSDKEMF